VLKRILPIQAELGMYIERFEGGWFSHPFWKSRFVLNDASNVETVRASSVKGVIIDTAKGADIAQPETNLISAERQAQPPSLADERLRAVSPRSAMPSAARAHLPTSRQQFGNAKRVARHCGRKVWQVFLKAGLGGAVTLREVEPVIDEIYQSIAGNPQILNAVLRCQRNTGEVYRHSLAVSSLMVALGRAIRLTPEQTKIAGVVGLLMDVGVGQMSEHVEQVGGDYRALPAALLEQHVIFGFDIVTKLEGIPQDCVRACLDHHERIDGSGYPAGATGEDIGRLAHLAAICDEFGYLVRGGALVGPLDPH